MKKKLLRDKKPLQLKIQKGSKQSGNVGIGLLQNVVNKSPPVNQLKAIQQMANKSIANKGVVQQKVNNTGLPNQLKSGIENLSGLSMDDVKVHYNSPKPAQLQAHAYAQGTDIHLASGQEKHLPHEAWHVVQQKQGRVKPTMQMKGKVNINDDVGLEREADVMGEKAMQSTILQRKELLAFSKINPNNFQSIQRLIIPGKDKTNYTFEQIAEKILNHWPDFLAKPEEEVIISLVKRVHPEKDGKIKDWDHLVNYVVYHFRKDNAGFYSAEDQLGAASSSAEYNSPEAEAAFEKNKDKSLNEEQTNTLYQYLLKPDGKLAFDEKNYRLVTKQLDEHKIVPFETPSKWKRRMGRQKAAALMLQHQLGNLPKLNQVVKAGTMPNHDIGLFDTLPKSLLVRILDLGGELRQTLHAAKDDKLIVPHNPGLLGILRQTNRSIRTFIDTVYRAQFYGEHEGIGSMMTKASNLHIDKRIGKGKHLMIELSSGMIGVIDHLIKIFPIEGHVYLSLGGSPAPVMTLMEHLYPAAKICYLPLSGIKGGADNWEGPTKSTWAEHEATLRKHFDRFIPNPGELHGRKIVVVDYASTGTGINVASRFLKKYYQEEDVVRTFALTTKFHRPTLDNGTEDMNLKKSRLGEAMEKQTLKGSGLRSTGKVDTRRLIQHELRHIPVDIPSLLRMLAQVQLILNKK